MSNDTSTPSQRGGQPPGAVKTTWTETRSTIHEFCHKWTIDNFSYWQPNTVRILRSSAFTSATNNAIKWLLLLYPHGHRTGSDKEYLSLYLITFSAVSSGFISTKFVFSIVDASGNATNDVQGKFSGGIRPIAFMGRAGNRFIKRDFLEQHKDRLLPDDKLVLLCKGSYTLCVPEIVSENSKAKQFLVPESEMLDDLGSLLTTQDFSDVILDVCGSEFHAHKAILSARSSVFLAMFNSEMKEQEENRVIITDTDPRVFAELLRFLYTDKAPKLKDVAAKLIYIADKYAVLRLKDMCAASLLENLSVDNAADTLMLADLHNAEKLKSMTMDFISSHSQAVINTESYKTMFRTHPHLAAEALTAVVQQHVGHGKAAKRPLIQ